VEQEPDAISLERVLAVLRRRAPLILACALVVGVAAFAFSKHQPRKYTAQATLNFEPSPLYNAVSGLPTTSPNNSVAILSQQSANIELVKSGNTAAQTAAAIGHGVTAAQVKNAITVSGEGETQIIFLSATSRSPGLAATIANTYAALTVKNVQRENLASYRAAVAALDNRLRALKPTERNGPEGVSLRQRAEALQLLSELQVASVRVSAQASPPSAPSSPKTSRNTAVGLIAGFLIGLLLTLLLERLDRKVRDAEELEELHGLPLLGSVPKSSALARAERGGKDAADSSRIPVGVAEGFSLIRARLRFFNIDHEVRSVMIASAEPAEGKSTVARRLAESAARVGDRVLLIEADLRHPTLAERTAAAPGPGLAGVLIGNCQPADAIRTLPLHGPPEGKSIDVLCAGSLLPPNPAELLEARSVDDLLLRERTLYDLIVIDTPPLTVVSDAFPLLAKVDGVVVVARIGHSRRRVAQQLKEALAQTGAPLLGLVVNGSRTETHELDSYYRGTVISSGPSTNGSAPAEHLASTPEA
jgi:capsular exopolysaccharide synthesis family protein